MDFEIVRIEHHPDRPQPLTVVLQFASGDVRSLGCKASTLATFDRFQQTVADRLGIWLQCPTERHPSRLARKRWQEQVSAAFEARRDGAEESAKR